MSFMKKKPAGPKAALNMGFQPLNLFKGHARLASIVAKIPSDVLSDLEVSAEGPFRWPLADADDFIKPSTLGITPSEWRELRKRIKRGEDVGLGLFEECVATVLSQPYDCHIGCPCMLVARRDPGEIVMIQRYDPEVSDTDRELGVFDRVPTLGEVISLIGMILNDYGWLQAQDDVVVLPTWQETLRKLDDELGWEMGVGSSVYPGLGDYFSEEWIRACK